MYGHRVWNAQCTNQHLEILQKDSVSQSWGEIMETHLLDGPHNLIKTPDAQSHTRLYRRLTRQLKTYGI